VDETSKVTHTAPAKDEFFSAGMHMFHITGVPAAARCADAQGGSAAGRAAECVAHRPGQQPARSRAGRRGCRLQHAGLFHRQQRQQDPADPEEIMEDHPGGCTRRHRSPRRDDVHHLKSMYNDPSQMREALAWRLFGRAGIPAARHTYAKLAFDATYYGLFSVIEQVDKRFLKDRFGANHRGNLYKAYCGDVGCATLEHRTGPGGDDSGRQYYRAGAGDNRTYRLKTNEDTPAPVPTMTWPSSSGRSTAQGSAAETSASTPTRSASRSTAS